MEEINDQEVTQEEAVTQTEETPTNSATEVLEDGTYRVDFSRMAEEPTEDTTVEEPMVEETVEEQEVPVLQDVTDEPEPEYTEAPTVEEQIEQPNSEPQIELPEAVKSLIDFMEETGGTIEDYARLNADYSSVDENSLLLEYYKSTKPHLSREEIEFMIDDKFSFDEDMDEERDIRRKKLAYKEELLHAKNHLEGLKSKYYQELKLGSRLTKDQQQAVEFFEKYKQEQTQAEELTAKQQKHFEAETSRVFNDNFKGFDFQVGDKKFRYNVKDVQETKQAQSNLFNAFEKYVDGNNLLSDARGYHKSLFAARNPDALANHFYEQGKADAIREMTAQAKNIKTDRQDSSGYVEAGGTKVRVISGENSSNTKLRLKNY